MYYHQGLLIERHRWIDVCQEFELSFLCYWSWKWLRYSENFQISFVVGDGNKSDETHVWPCFLLQNIRCWLCAFVFKDERVTWVKKLQTVREIDTKETKRIVVLHIEKILYFQVECLVLNVIIAWQYIPYIYSNVITN